MALNHPSDRSAEPIALTPAQTDVWRAQKLAPADPLFNIGGYVEIFSGVDPQALMAAVGRALEDCDSMRLRLIDTPDGPAQVSATVGQVDIPQLDFRASADPHAAALAWMQADLERPFDLLDGAPLYRFALIALGERHTLGYAAFHHLISDLSGGTLFLRRVCDLYSAMLVGNVAPLPALSFWSDVVADTQQYQSSARCERDRAYWNEQLSGLPPPVTLSGRSPAWPKDTLASQGSLSGATVAKLAALGATYSSGLVGVLYAAAALYLARIVGERDIVLGMPVANRVGSLLRLSTGFVANVLPLRLQVNLDQPVSELVRETGVRLRGALRHARYPWSALRKDLGFAPHAPNFFGLMFNFVPNETQIEFAGRPARLYLFTDSRRVQDCNITFHARDDGSDVLVRFDANAACYDRDGLDKHRRAFLNLLEAVAAQPAAACHSIDLLVPWERRQLMAWGSGALGVSGMTGVELIEDQVKRTPGAIAVEGWRESISYEELNGRANQVAHRLQKLGVGRGCVVGLWADRSVQMLVGLLGIWKAGAAYLPLDPAYPAERLRVMLSDAKPRLLLSSAAASEVLRELGGGIAQLDPGEVSRESRSDPERVGELSDAAYVMYTSGSSGRPKAVVVPHAGLSALAASHGRHLQVRADSRVLQFAALTFDVSVAEVLTALSQGARLVLARAGTLGGEGLRDLLRERQVTHALLTPAVLATVKRTADLSLQTLVIGGEACPAGLIEQWSTGLRLINAYGPTESTVCATLSEPLAAGELASIGKPIEGTRVYVLDAALGLVPSGVAGELYIAGVGLACGYLNQPALTAERFVADPYGESGSRMYRSGDWVRWRDDGTLEYLGRIDRQVKIRGHRIELEEIEAQLCAHESIAQAAVTTHEDSSGKYLAGYVVARAGREADSQALRRALAQRLPQHMVPAHIVVLPSLPLTPSGKLDRRALPVPTQTPDQSHEAPTGPVENKLASICAEILKVERMGRHDDFFEAGGNSLQLIELVDRLADLGWRIEASQLFKRPTIAAMAVAIDVMRGAQEPPANRIPKNCARITPDMLQLLELGQVELDDIANHVAGGTRNIQDIYPLAPLQEGILVHYRTTPRDTYVLKARLSVDSEECVTAFLRALQALIDRHDVLRTAIQWEGLREPVQVVWREARLEAVKTDAATFEQYLNSQPRIDVARAPMLRLYLAPERQSSRWQVLWHCHHLILDHSSLESLLAELQAHLQGRTGPLPSPLPFRDFVSTARAAQHDTDHAAFFSNMLADIEEPTTPFGMTDVRADGLNITEAGLGLELDLARRVRQQAHRHGAAPSSLFHLAWAMVLARISARHDVVFGTVLFGRMHGALHRAIGLYINTLPIRLCLGKTAAAALLDVHSRLGELLRHEQISLMAVQRLSALPAHAPLFSAVFNYRYDPKNFSSRVEAELAPGIRLLAAEERTNYPLGLFVDDLGDGFNLTAQAAQPIDPARICRLMMTAVTSLTSALEQTSQADLRTLEVIPASERRQLMAWGSGALGVSGMTGVELIEDQVKRTPGAIAVEGWRESISYEELNGRANQVAHRLQKLGVGRGCVVGLWADRSVQMLVGLLGIWKAGAAYLPLDPAYPAERLRVMLSDAKPRLLLSSAAASEVLRELGGGIAQLDPGEVSRESRSDPERVGELSDAAYVMYTSGSSGRPKAVVVPHAGLSALAASHGRHLQVRADSRVLQFAALTFDVSVAEVLTALSQGARLVLARAGTLGGEGLRDLLRERQVTHALLTPAVLATVKRTADLSLQTLVIGGEACPAGLIEQWSTGLRLINAYGPIESTVYATLSEPLAAGELASIGKPIEGTRVYVLDAALGLVPSGVAGELYIAGVGLACGYLNQPALTAERFVADPYGESGSRMYRSGDWVRWRDDGTLEYLGRIDRQVKIRGHRIELEEIEAQLCAHESIAQAAVTTHEDSSGKYLAGYVVARAGREADSQALRRALAQRLPQHMVPAHIVVLPSLPLTPSGKLDRRALPVPAQTPDQSREAPGSRTERELAAIWRDVLRIGEIGRTDDFFASGGHSLSALQVVSRVRDVFKIELPLKTLFDAPTLEALAQAIEQALAAGEARSLAPVTPQSWHGLAPLSHSQERMWLIQSLNPSSTAYNMGTALWLNGSLDVEALAESFDELVRRHEILRTRVKLVAERPRQVIDAHQAGLLRYEDLRSISQPMSAALENASNDLRAVFDLNRGPVIRARLLRTADEKYLLSVVLHHIAGDLWSMGILGRELAALYNYRRNGLRAPLEPLPVSYRDYSNWQRSGAGAAENEQQLRFWTRQLAGLPAVDLPVDFVRPKVWTMNGSVYQREMPPWLFDAVADLARSNGSTMFMTLFAGFAAMLQRLTGQADLPIGVPVANRTSTAVERLVGTFVNTVIVRADVQGDPGFNELLSRIRDTTLTAFAHQDVSFARLVQELGQRGDRSRAPLAQVLFNVANAPVHGIELNGMTWEDAGLDQGGAQFELSFTVDTELSRRLTIGYNTDLFERRTVERLAGQYFALLGAAAAAPATRISRLPIVPAEERAILEAWNAGSYKPAGPQTFPTLFEMQAARTPDAVAVSFRGARLSYDELNQRANGLARALRQAGIGPGQTVGVCMPRSEKLLIGLLGVQKSAGTYVPLDPHFPAERLRYMLADCGAKALLCVGPLPAGLEVPGDVQVIDVAGDFTSVRDNPGSERLREDTAYVLYTSGSTGSPKGVTVSHGALANFLLSMAESPGLAPSDVLAAVTTVSFDIAGLELYLPLLVGATIELVPSEVAGDGTALAGLLDSSGATVFQATPATWRLLIDSGWRGNPRLRALCGGEALPRKLANEILERVSRLWNMYGPTETTIWSTLDEVTTGDAAISIGRPIANTRVCILDGSGAMAPIGTVGEICIGGSGVATGYHRRPALTAERFVADEFSTVAGARLYRTGDLGRWANDGKLYHLGRSDHQVKIRGFRIELGEVETAIASHRAVSHAVAMVRKAGADDLRLVAYVVFNDGDDATNSDIKRFLRRQLPDYMIPSIIVSLLSLPLTPNGKVDRAALPDPFAAARQDWTLEERAASGLEELLAETWKSVLQVPTVLPSDNFFELGGYSLLSLKVVRLVEKRSGKRLDPRILFFHSLREVAQILERDTATSPEEVS